MTAMTDSKTLLVKHTLTWRDEPLLCFRNLPGYDAELSPAAARALADALLQAADDCEALRGDARRYGPQVREYTLAEVKQ